MKHARRPGHRRWWGRLNLPLVVAGAMTLVCALAFIGDRRGLWTVPGIDSAELIAVDARFRLRGGRAPSVDDIVVVGLDDQTRSRMPHLFQTRRGYAELIAAIDGYAPRAIGLDLFFTAPEVTLTPETAEAVRAAHQELTAAPGYLLQAPARTAREALGAVVEELRGDELLAAAVAASGRVQLGALFHLAEEPGAAAPAGTPEPEGLRGARYGESVYVEAPRSRRPPAAAFVTRSMASIAAGAAGAGAVNAIEDDDGKVRKVPGVIEHAGRFYMPLGLAMALQAGDSAQASYVVGSETIRAAGHILPAGPRGELYLSYLGGAESFPHVSAADVVSGDAPREALAHKLVFVGLTDAARDKIVTPLEGHVPGVVVHATLAHNILRDELVAESGPGTTLLALLLLGAAISALQLRRLRRRHPWLPAAAALGLVALYLGLAHASLLIGDVLVAVAWPTATALAVTLAAMATALATEGREKAQLRAAFSQYVNDTIVDRIIADPRRATLGGERRELTVLFSDIRGFSRFSEGLEPEALSAYLNEYLTPMTDLVMADGGMLDKYIGDAVMAVYGAPLDMTDHAERACRSALRMSKELGPLNERWRKRSLPEISIGVGINSGPMSVGNMGSERRFDYTVLGDAVNLAARLESLTKEYMAGVLVGARTVELAGRAFVFRELDWVRVKGRDGVASLYELIGERGAAPVSDEDLAVYAEALAHYRAREWDAAETGFAVYLERHPADGPAHMMRGRLADLRKNPPPEGWNGVFAQQSK